MKRIVFFVIFLTSLFIINNLVRSIYSLSQKQHLLTQTQEELNREKTENGKLNAQLKQVNSQAFLEEQARNKLFLVKPGEKIVVIAQPTSSPTPEEEKASPKKEAVWEQWLHTFF